MMTKMMRQMLSALGGLDQDIQPWKEVLANGKAYSQALRRLATAERTLSRRMSQIR